MVADDYNCISRLDSLIGDLLAALDRSGKADNTLVIFLSDHGIDLLRGKRTCYEGGTRVPLIVVAPGVTEPGSRTGQPASTLDIFPTLNELCNLSPPGDLDSLSLVPLLRDPQHVRERPALTTHSPGNHAVRSEHWRSICYGDGGEELYNHQSDPHEWTNLAGRPEHVSVKTDLAKWLPKTDAPNVSPGQNRRVGPRRIDGLL
jgi:choline-sulfatase